MMSDWELRQAGGVGKSPAAWWRRKRFKLQVCYEGFWAGWYVKKEMTDRELWQAGGVGMSPAAWWRQGE